MFALDLPRRVGSDGLRIASNHGCELALCSVLRALEAVMLGLRIREGLPRYDAHPDRSARGDEQGRRR
jgi:hypothetical protein